MADEFTPFFDENRNDFSSSDYLLKNSGQFPGSDTQDGMNDKEESQESAEAEQLQQIHEQARQQGYAEGMKQAGEEIHQQRQELIQWLQWIQHPMQLIDEECSQQIVETIAWICEECIGLELSVQPEKIKNLLEKVKDELPIVSGQRSMMMNPQDVAWLRDNLTKSAQEGLLDYLVEDEQLQRGDFYFKSEQVELDGQLKTRIRQILSDVVTGQNGKDKS